MSFNRDPLTKEEQAALEIIRGHRAIISMQGDYSFDDNNWDKRKYDPSETDGLVDQILDPNKNRPSLSENLFASKGLPRPATLLKTNMITGEVYKYEPGQCRHTKHKGVEFQHTAKTATSLIPPEPEYMHAIGDDLIGYLWDSDACDLKGERYVWEKDGASDLCYWLSPNPYNPQPHDIVPVAPISKLKENNLKAIQEKKVIFWNELDVGLPKKRIDAMFSPRDTLVCRLRVWNQMLRDKEKLRFENDIPLFIIQADSQDGQGSVFRLYGRTEREEDLKKAMTATWEPRDKDIMQVVVAQLATRLKVDLRSTSVSTISSDIFTTRDRSEKEFSTRSQQARKPLTTFGITSYQPLPEKSANADENKRKFRF